MVEKSMIPSALPCEDFMDVCWRMTLNPRNTVGALIQSVSPWLCILLLEISPIVIVDTFLARMLHRNIKSHTWTSPPGELESVSRWVLSALSIHFTPGQVHLCGLCFCWLPSTPLPKLVIRSQLCFWVGWDKNKNTTWSTALGFAWYLMENAFLVSSIFFSLHAL